MPSSETPQAEIVRHESAALDSLASRLLFEGGKPNASMFWDDEKQELRVHFNEDGKKFAFSKSTQTWHEFPSEIPRP